MSFVIEYYNAKVLSDIENWPVDILANYFKIAELLEEFGPEIRMPHSKPFGDGLLEIRARGKDGVGRAFYCFKKGKRIVILHSFVKKTQQTPAKELKLARKRRKEVSNA